ncbi:protein downstream neighbor of Son [Entomortierella parvispora]|uniref:Protein downstream neighbor of Son n=1 Tax=Entomortierella parvispora TaxID=205924 RepID=A0A9P3HNT7_9FUNG|nr:protein downstream neighbor of Son [Entomortierella parvispora]
MIPTKRQSPFTRTRSFQPSSSRQRIDTGTALGSSGGPPFSKRTGLSRTMSTPFQVLSPSMSSTKNPFEKLAPSPTSSPTSASSSTFVSECASLRIAEDQGEDEAMDPKSTLKMFSFSQPTPSASTKLLKDEDEDSSSEEEPEDDLDQGTDSAVELKTEAAHPLLDQKPRLQEALERSLSTRRKPTEEISAPSTSASSKKTRGEHKSSKTLPIDWTLKTAIFLTSPDSFSWCDEGSTAMDEITAMQLFMSGVTNSEDDLARNRKKTSPRIRLLSAMYHWTYPTNAATSSQAHSINRLLKNAETLDAAEKINVTEIFSRTGEWRQSFKSVYQMYRNGACPFFYYVGSSWTILFQHGSLSTSGDLEAILTNSTPGLRKVLGEEDISFVRLPDAGGKTAVHNFSSKHDLQGFDDENPETESSSSGKSFQLPAQQELSNTLLFQGQVEVQGLFSYLINQKLSFEDGFMYSSPRLIANVPFLHAALKSNTVSKCRLVSRNIEGTDKMQKEYRIEIQGTILPTSTQDLCRLCSDQQQPTGYKFTAQSELRSHGLNLRPLYKGPGFEQVRKTRSAARLSEDSFVGTKSLDQFRFDHTSSSYSWST